MHASLRRRRTAPVHRSRLEALEDRRLLASFQGLGDLAGGGFGSQASDVSADGSVVVGFSASANGPDGEAFRWTSAGMERLGDLEHGLFQSSAWGVSADGSVVVGEGWSVDIEDLETPTREAFRWTESIGMQGLGHLWAGNLVVDDSSAMDVSADGSLVVGQSYSLAPAEDGSLVQVVEAFRTTAPHLMEGLGDLEGGGFFSGALGVSDDGSVIVGFGTNESGLSAVRWTSTGPEDLGDLAGGAYESMAFAASADGSVVVGYSSISPQGNEAFRWTAADNQMIGLGDLPGGEVNSTALGVSANGSIVVGAGESADGDEAFRWSELSGMESIRTRLVNAGIDMTGWQLTAATGISADGSVIVGTGINPDGQEEAWRADLGGLSDFTNTAPDQIGTLSIDIAVNVPAEIAFYVSADGKFDKGQDEEFLKVDLSSIGASEFLVSLEDHPDIPGDKRLTLNPAHADGATLRTKLEDEKVATIFAVADPDGDKQSFAPFRGFYRAANGPLAVLRTGPDSKDAVTVNMNSLSFTANTADDKLIKSKSTSRGSIDNLLVVTGELKDIIHVDTDNTVTLRVLAGGGDDEIDSGGGNDVLDGGLGSDTYWFRATAGGDDEIREQGEGIADARDRLDFSFFTNAEGARIALDHKDKQQVASNLSLRLKSPVMLEDVTGSDFNDFIRGNDKVNQLIGREGDDILVGLDGGDTLNGDGDFDILLGDGFTLDGGVELTPSDWNTLYDDFAKFVKGEGEGEDAQFTLSFRLALTPSGSGEDTIEGGAGDDLIIGGDGNDTITAGGGKALIFGDAFYISAGFDLEFSASFDDLSKVSTLFVPELDFGHSGNGIDTITSGTENSLVIGGDGDDIITGGDGAIEILLGNDGNDTIDGKNGLNVIIGGEGAEKSLRGGANVNFILGDWIEFKAGSSPLTLSATDLKPLADLISGLTLAGTESDGDTIEGGAGPNFIFGGGGNDTITGGNGAFDLLLGNAGNDSIKGQNGLNFIFGGKGSDPLLEGGADFNLIASGELTFKSFDAFAVTGETTFRKLVSFIEALFSAFSLAGDASDVDKMVGGSGPNLILGGEGQDTIIGGNNQASIDALFGFENGDRIEGKAGFNLIVGGDGDDPLLEGGDDGNVIIGDHLVFEGFSIDFDKLFSFEHILGAFKAPKFEVTGSGFDRITGGNGFDFLVGGDGQDEIRGGNGLNIVFCDRIELQFGGAFAVIQNFVAFAGLISSVAVPTDPFDLPAEIAGLINKFEAVWNELFGDTSDLKDDYWGGNDNDIVFGGGGGDALRGGEGKDFLVGGLGYDWFLVEPECEDPDTECWIEDGIKDIAFGGEGDDEFHGGPGPDFLASTEGNDKFFGYGGDDVIFGGDGDDELQGGDGDDALVGEAGNDFIDGGAGADRIYAGPGSDTIISDPEDQVDDPVDRLPGDTNLDGRVDLVDLNNVRNNFGAVGAGVLGDANDDERVDVQDLNAVRNNFGATVSSGVPFWRAMVGTTPSMNHRQVASTTATARPARRSQQDALFAMAEGPYYTLGADKLNQQWKKLRALDHVFARFA